MCRCPEWKVQTNVKLAAPGATKQNSSKFKLSEQIWSKEIAIAWRNAKWKRRSRRTTLLRRYLPIVRLWGVPSRYGKGTVYPRRTYYSAPRKAAEDRVDCLAVNKIDRPNTTPTVRVICTFAVYFLVFRPFCCVTVLLFQEGISYCVIRRKLEPLDRSCQGKF